MPKSVTVFVAICFLLIGWGTPAAFAENPEPSEAGIPLTLPEAIAVALANNPQLKAEQAKLRISEAAITTAGARNNPYLLTDNGVIEKTYRLGFEQKFELGGKRRHRISLAEAQRDAVLETIHTVILDLRTNVRRAYTQLFMQQARLQDYQQILQTTQTLLDIARKRETAGDISTLDVLAAETANLSAKNDYESVAYQVVLARNNLNNLLNQPLAATRQLSPPATTPETPAVPQPPGKPPVLQGSVQQEDIRLDKLLELAFSHRPELKLNAQNLTVTRRQMELAKANRMPNLTLSVGPDLVTPNGHSQYGVFAIALLELPILNRQQGPIQEAVARQAQLELEQAALSNRVTLDVTNAYTTFLFNRDRLARYERDLLPKSREIVKKSEHSFSEGKSSIVTAIAAQQAFINTRLSYLQSLLEYQNAISDLERAIGTGL